MPDENVINEKETSQTAPKPDLDSDIKSGLSPQFSLSEDLKQLEKLNLLKAVILRFQGGKHPNAEIDGLLKRRMNFDSGV